MKSFLKNKFKTLYFFYQYLGYRLFVLLGFGFLTVIMDTIGLTMFVPLLQVAEGQEALASSGNTNRVGEYVQQIFYSINIDVTVANMLLLITVLFILKGISFYFVLKYKGILLQVFMKKIRYRLAIGLRDMNYKEFVSTDIGRLQNSLTGESWQVANASNLYLEVIKNGLFVFIYLLFAFLIDWRFSVLVTIGGGITNVIYKKFYTQTQTLSRAITKNNHRYGAIVIEVANHFKYLKATGRNYAFVNLLNTELDKLIKNNIDVAVLNARLVAMREPLMIMIIIAVISVHIFVFNSTISSIMVILLLFYRAMQTIMDLQNNWNNYMASIGSIENVMAFQKYLGENKEVHQGGRDLTGIEDIRLQNVNLFYGNFKALDNICVEIRKNQSIAFVGESGSGKTSLVNVICGLLPYGNGKFTVNGVDINNYDIRQYKQKIGYITQESTIFNATIFDNVTFWDEKNEKNITKFNSVIGMCGLRSFLDGFSDFENTLLGNNGVSVSGGQKQRISIARELYRDVEILIMDEATSALDSRTEKVVKESIESLHGKVTIISIAHRLSTVQHANVIYLMERGQLVASGDFNSLKGKSSYFKRLTELQGM